MSQLGWQQVLSILVGLNDEYVVVDAGPAEPGMPKSVMRLAGVLAPAIPVTGNETPLYPDDVGEVGADGLFFPVVPAVSELLEDDMLCPLSEALDTEVEVAGGPLTGFFLSESQFKGGERTEKCGFKIHLGDTTLSLGSPQLPVLFEELHAGAGTMD